MKKEVSWEARQAAQVRFPELHALQYGYAVGYDEAMALVKEEFLALMVIIIETHKHVSKEKLVGAMVETLREFSRE